VRSLESLPFVDGAFDAVVLDTNAAGIGHPARPALRNAASELARVTGRTGDLILVTRHRRLPRHGRPLRDFRLRTDARAWEDAVADTPFRHSRTCFVQLDGRRMTEVLSPEPDGAAAPHDDGADRRLSVFSRRTDRAPSLLGRILQEAGHRLGDSGAARLDRFLVRKIGKTAVMASVAGRRVIIRIPRSPIASIRAGRNFEALHAIHASALLPADDRSLVPKALARGQCAGYAYYVEEQLDGAQAEGPAAAAWEAQALRFITTLHVQTARPNVLDDATFERAFAAPLRRIRAFAAGPELRVLDGLTEHVRAAMGEPLPFVWSHGDFAAGNCLYHPPGRLSAVVDWELFSTTGLPLLDVLQCMPIPRETNSHPSWQRFDRVLWFLRHDPSFESSPELSDYAGRMALSTRIVRALLVLYWIDHVSNRVAARWTDPAWMAKRFHQPLAAFPATIRSGRGAGDR
jgi:aminoglycoside phosphotransferase (APT) family kinase protein